MTNYLFANNILIFFHQLIPSWLNFQSLMYQDLLETPLSLNYSLSLNPYKTAVELTSIECLGVWGIFFFFFSLCTCVDSYF